MQNLSNQNLKRKILIDKNKYNINENKKLYSSDYKKIENSMNEKKKFFKDSESQTYVNSVLDKLLSM